MTTVERLSLLLLTAALALPAGAQAADQTVNPGDNVQEKVDAANAGETVTFKAGTHTAAITVADADITLKGEAGALLVNTSGTAATITFSGSDGKVHDLAVASSVGDGIVFATGANELMRSAVVTTKAADAVAAQVTGGALGDQTLTVDSTILVGPTALRGATVALLDTTAVTARHVTAIGALVATGTATSATFTVTDSIVMGARTAVTVDTDRNFVADDAAAAGVTFVRPAAYNFHLRADAPVIGLGKVTSGESATDIDGDPRSTGEVSDYGADEFVNKAPAVTLAAPAGTVRENAAVTLTATGADPEAASGGGIASYAWNYGDGTTETTTTPTVSHAYATRKAYAVSVTVTDKQGATSTAASTEVTVIDGIAPTATIQQPGVKERVTLYKKAKKGKKAKRRRVLFFGTAADDTALGSVVLALRKVAVKDGKCSWYNGKKGFVKSDCSSPALLTPKLVDGQWRYTLPRRARLRKGPYQLYVVPIDASGLAGTAQTVAFRFR